MKKLFSISLLLLTVLFNSCGVNQSEKTADEFHQKLDAGEYDYIVNNLMHEDAINQLGEDTWYGIFYEIEARWGVAKSREKDFGFESKTDNGVTRVKLDYTCTYPEKTVYERMFLASSSDGGYKIFGLYLNENKEQLHQIAGDLE